jgi:hypothetical protein
VADIAVVLPSIISRSSARKSKGVDSSMIICHLASVT